jgi:alkyldihydroxyacetonephosphate synthase
VGEARRRSYWGWGYEEGGPSAAERERLREALALRWGRDLPNLRPPPVSGITLRPPRVALPASLEHLAGTGTYERLSHSYGKSYRDLVRAIRGEFPNPPDIVAYPRSEDDVVRLLDWCSAERVAVVPYGGGSSVVGGVEPSVGETYRGVATIDMSRLGRVLEVDRLSRAALVQAGAYGPALEDQLRPSGLTLRHFPQSFEFSTLGGWIATRSGGHYATARTHIDDFVESVRMVTPSGLYETRRLPGSGAGPSPDRLVIGSEGALGILTRAWMRLQDRPRFRRSAGIRFADFSRAVAATRELAQSGLEPAGCRLLDPLEALTGGAGDGSASVLVLGFESADHPVDWAMSRALEICEGHRGEVPEEARSAAPREEPKERSGAAGAWRRSFLAAPYLRDALVCMGALCETFETAVTWQGFEALHAEVLSAAHAALREVGAGPGSVTCRFTHVYPDGPAPYFTVLGPAREGAELEQWDTIKAAVSEAVLAGGGTITHHHAVGRDHRPWYDRQRPALFAKALSSAKGALDPAWVMNPGVLLDAV